MDWGHEALPYTTEATTMNLPLSFLRHWISVLPLRFWDCPWSAPVPKRPCRFQPQMEVLEDRTLMTGNITVLNTSLLSAPITAGAGNGPDSAAILRKDDGQKLELIANYYDNTVSVYQLGTNGSLALQTTLATGQGPNGFVVADLGNGHQDFTIANYLDNTFSVFMGDGQGHFTLSQTVSTGSGPSNEMAGWSSGGKFYLATADYNDGTVDVFQSTGPGTFAADGSYSVGAGAIAVTAGNFTGGSGNDLAVANYTSSTLTILQNNGDNTFTVESPISVGSNPWYVAGGDFAGTGVDSLVTANFWSNNVTVIPALGNNTFGTPQNYAVGANPTGVAVGDFNGDGTLDLLVSNFSSNDVSYLEGNGDGTFQNAVSYSAGSGPNELAVGYVGGSGNLDALVADQSGNAASLLLNQSLQGYVGQTFTGSIASFTDSDPSITSPSDFSATITWGDGQTSTVGASAFSETSPGVYTLTASHVYSATGLYAGSVTITDTDNNTGTGSFTVGIHPAVTGTIQGTVFDDENGDGQQQSSDPGLSGWTVQLLNPAGQVVATTQTATNGTYSFANLLPGTYTVQEVLQSGYTKTAGPSENLIVDPNETSTANFGNFQEITIAGTVFNDANGDAIQQPYELGLPGIAIQLYTESNGNVSANPLQTTTTDPNGKYQFANIGPLPAGTSYVVAEVVPAGTNETTPASSSNTITLPDGSIGYIVPAIGGVALDLNGQPSISGTGSYTFNSLADTVTGAISFNDGQGNSGSGIEAYISPFNLTFNNGVNAPVSFTSFCIDLTHEINVGGTYPVAVQTNEATAYANGSRMAFIEQTFGRGAITTDQAVAVQIALWDLALNNHNPTYFKQDGSVYDSGDPSVFSVANLSTNPADTAEIVMLVNQYLGASASIDPPGADLGSMGSARP